MKGTQEPSSGSGSGSVSLLGDNYDSLPLQSLLSAEGRPDQPLVRVRESLVRELRSS